MMAGINFVPMILGLFAISEVFIQSQQIVVTGAAPPAGRPRFPERCASSGPFG